jgi:hypothetical protein
MNRKVCLPLVAIAALTSAATAAVLDVDQPVRTNNLYFDNGVGAARPGVGQSFVPSLPVLTRVDINLVGPVSGMGPDVNSTQFSVTIFNAGGSADGHGPTGSALGSKTVDYNNLTDLGDPNSFDTFEFDSPIALVPGNLYFIQVTMQDFSTTAVRAFNVGQSVNASYAPGNGLVLENDLWQLHDGSDARDLQFRTYGVIPEPATAAVLAGAALLMASRRRA